MTERYPDTLVDEVLSRTDLRSVVEPYVKLVRRGGRFFGLCPFHKEKSGSFSVSPEQGLFYCFGCGAGGSAIQFLMRLEGWTFPETFEELAKRAGVLLPELHPEQRQAQARRRSEQSLYHEVVEQACRHFEDELHSGRYPIAEQYLDGRGVDPATARVFRLGCVGPSWDSLLTALAKDRVSGETLEKAGLVLSGKQGGFYDRFRDRITFPVVDHRGRVVGFSARALGKVDKQKYINSPELPFFKKGEHLYGLHAAKPNLRKERNAIVVEGNFDVVTLHAAGFNTALAPMGTALTTRQVALLKRVADSVVLVFDGDTAGQRAMLKCMTPTYQADLPVSVVVLPDGSDPDSYVREHGTEPFRHLLDNARPLAEVAVDQVIRPAVGGSPEQRVGAARAAVEVLEDVPEGPVRSRYLADVGRRLEFSVRELRGLGAAQRRRNRVPEPARSSRRRLRPLTQTDRLLIRLCACESRFAARILDAIDDPSNLSDSVRTFLEMVVRESNNDFRIERLIGQLDRDVEPVEDGDGGDSQGDGSDSQGDGGGLREQILSAVSSPEPDPEDLELAFQKTVWQLKTDIIKRQIKQLSEEMLAADRSGDIVRFAELAERDIRLTQAQMELQRQQPRG